MTITIPLWLIWTFGIVGVIVALPILALFCICAYVGYVMLVGKRSF